MNWQDIIKALNDFRGRKFLIVLGSGVLMFYGKLGQYFFVCITVAYFITDLIEKYIIHKTEDEQK